LEGCRIPKDRNLSQSPSLPMCRAPLGATTR
jgi:hypothetical protein